MYFLEAIYYVDYGQSIYHRVFGEYKNNMTNEIGIFEVLGVFGSAGLDFMIFILFVVAEIFYFDTPVDVNSGKTMTQESQVIFYSVLFSILHLSRYRSVLSEVWTFITIDTLFFCLSINLLLVEDRENLFQTV